MITELTPEQEAQLPVFRDKYMKLASSPTPMNREAIEDAMGRAYGALGRPKPVVVILKSPHQAMIAVALFKAHGYDTEKFLGIWNSLSDEQKDQL